jgi:hypothetical protein
MRYNIFTAINIFVKKTLLITLQVFLLFWIVRPAFADDFELADEFLEGSSSQQFIIDTDNEAGAGEFVTLQFGETIGETLVWDIDNDRFAFSDSVRIEGNGAIVGQLFVADNHAATDSDGFINLGRNSGSFESITWNDTADSFAFSDDIDLNLNQVINGRIENLSAEPTCDAGSAGRMYHNTTNNNSFVCDGTSFVQIDGATASNTNNELASVQARRDTTFNITGTFADVTLNQTDVENNTSSIQHDDTNTDRILINADGLYLISYEVSLDGNGTFITVDSRIRNQDSTIVSGSEGVGSTFDNGSIIITSPVTRSFLANLSSGDFLTLQLQSSANIATINDIVFDVIRLDNISGTGADASIAQVYEAGTTTFNNGTPVAVDWDGSDAATRFVDSGYTHNPGGTPSQITINSDGLYEINYNVNWDTSANARRTLRCDAFVNNVAVNPPVGRSFGYARNSTDDNETNSATFMRSLSNTNTLDIRCINTGSTGNVISIANSSWLTIKKIR